MRRLGGVLVAALGVTASLALAIPGSAQEAQHHQAATDAAAMAELAAAAEAAGNTAAPIFAPGAGAVPAGSSIAISCPTPEAAIFYTNDGSSPTRKTLRYLGPIVVTAPTTFKAIAFASGLKASPVATATYTLGSPPPSESGGTLFSPP